jgi:PAS domain S-box-containing protein
MTDRSESLEIFFSQSLDGFFFMMLDEPVRWDDTVDKDAILDYVLDHQRITKVNEAMAAQYGAKPEQLLGLTPRDLYRHDLEHARMVWREFLDRGRLHVETDERRLDGVPIAIEGDYICFHDAAGLITGHFGIQRDVTERKHHAADLERRVAERTLELRRTENRLRAIIHAIQDMVFVMDGDGRYVEVLAGAEDHLHSAEELRGKTLHDVLDNETARAFLDAVRTTIASERSQMLEYSLRMPAGIRWFEGRTALLGTNIEEKPCIVFAARDITDRKRAEELETQNIALREELTSAGPYGTMVGESTRMREVFTRVEMVAATESTVLLLGETGTGKELLARAIHEASKRRNARMVKVNCGAFPSGLVESELFGHEKGAFTGATQQKKGRFELAQKGTLLLDEVGELPLDVQVKLLRVLQEREFERVGGTQTIHVDVRLIAATNRDLEEEVRSGAFRADLYYRLNVFPIEVPPLRERKEDIPLLANQLVSEISRRIGKRIERIETRAKDRLEAYHWPGNVRELANILERAVILCRGNTLLEEHVGLLDGGNPAAAEFQTLEQLEREHIIQALERTGGVVAGPRGAARLLGLNRSTLWSRMKRLGIQEGRS